MIDCIGRKFLLLAFATAVGLVAEPPTPTTFEVASIKPSDPGGHGMNVRMAPGGRFNASNITVKFLMQQAYGVKDFQIVGGPGWMNGEHYDITAKAPDGSGNLSQENLKPMIQALLADRFKLTVSHETKELPIYALVVAKGGPKLVPNTESPAPATSDSPAPGPARVGTQMRIGRGQLNGTKMPVSVFAAQLANVVGRAVIDKTDIKGDFDFKLEWTPAENEARFGGPEGAPPASDTPGPSIFTALQEQLGLKLETQKGPVDILVINHIEKPSEN